MAHFMAPLVYQCIWVQCLSAIGTLVTDVRSWIINLEWAGPTDCNTVKRKKRESGKYTQKKDARVNIVERS